MFGSLRSQRGESDIVDSIAHLVVVVLFALVWQACTGSFDSQEVNFQVEEKERTQDDYLVWVEHTGSGDRSNDKAGKTETMQVDDQFLITYTSSDTYGELEEGSCYNATVFGRRIPWLSMWRSITHVTEVPCSE